MDSRRTYTIIVQGNQIPEPVDYTEDLPEWLGDLILSAQKEKHPDGIQESALHILLYRARELYRGTLDSRTVSLKADNVRLIDPFTTRGRKRS